MCNRSNPAERYCRPDAVHLHPDVCYVEIMRLLLCNELKLMPLWKQAEQPSSMDEQYIVHPGKSPLAYLLHQSVKCFACIYRVKQYALQPCCIPDKRSFLRTACGVPPAYISVNNADIFVIIGERFVQIDSSFVQHLSDST